MIAANALAPSRIAAPLAQPLYYPALAVCSKAPFDPAELAAALHLPMPKRLLLLSGGAGEMSAAVSERLKSLFQAVGEVLVEADATVIDGGTQFGAVALLGEALAQAGQRAPYIGVLPAHAKISSTGLSGEEVLERHHSHFVLVESSKWGEESEIMYGLAAYLSRQAASVALLVNGGGISLNEVEWNVKQGREIIVVAGSGRLADEIAAAVRRPQAAVRERIAAVVQTGKLTLFDLSESLDRLTELLMQSLKST